MKLKNILLSIISGILLAFSFPNFIQQNVFVFTFFLIWVAFVPLFSILYEVDNYKRIFFYGFLSGSVFYLMSLYWLCNVRPMGVFAYVAWVALSLYISLFFGFSLLISLYLKQKLSIDYLFSVPVIFTILEYVREWLFTGFPLQTPAQSQIFFLPFIKIIKITGVAGANFLIYFINIFLTSIILRKKTNLLKIEKVALIIIIVILIIFIVITNIKPKHIYKNLKISILQPDISQDVVEWTGNYKEKTLNIIKEMILKLKQEKPNIIVWPETGYPGVLNYEQWRAKEIAGWIKGAWHIIGSDKVEIGKNDEKKYYNSVFIIDEEGDIKGDYSKYHLVPFGEYVPLQNVFPFIKKVVRRYGYIGFTPGNKIEPVLYKDIKIGTLICYDSLFPEISREFIRKGAVILVHLSYETWYGKTPASAQIFQNTAMRAVENEVSLVRCVASGISGFVNYDGKIISKTDLFKRDILTEDVTYKEKNNLTFYTKYGDWFIFFILFIMIIIIIFDGIKKNVNVNY
ncbi:MAG: apolipoprotein N-acyltransferase [Candidatus Goldbacteria bacterium]|nr:apolipoprotein N-acyltransferase [Candidatus Goldiibacteriota bacterium]